MRLSTTLLRRDSQWTIWAKILERTQALTGFTDHSLKAGDSLWTIKRKILLLSQENQAQMVAVGGEGGGLIGGEGGDIIGGET